MQITVIRHFKGIRKSDELCKQVDTIIAARILYHSNSYT